MFKIVLKSKRQSYRHADNNADDYHGTLSPPEIDYLEYTSMLIEPVSSLPLRHAPNIIHPYWQFGYKTNKIRDIEMVWFVDCCVAHEIDSEERRKKEKKNNKHI